jgi:hypothetical protein
MREVISIATMFLILAAAGMEPAASGSAKTCRTDPLAVLLSPAC